MSTVEKICCALAVAALVGGTLPLFASKVKAGADRIALGGTLPLEPSADLPVAPGGGAPASDESLTFAELTHHFAGETTRGGENAGSNATTVGEATTPDNATTSTFSELTRIFSGAQPDRWITDPPEWMKLLLEDP